MDKPNHLEITNPIVIIHESTSGQSETGVVTPIKDDKEPNTYYFHDIEAHSPMHANHNEEPEETVIMGSSRSRFDSGMDEDDLNMPSKIFERRPEYMPNDTPLHERDPHEFTVIIIGAMALAFNSGFINGATLSSLHPIPVSHVTGTTTHAALDLASSDYEHYAIRMAIISCFIFGSGITGAMMPQNSFQLGREYGPLFIIGSCLLLFACITAYATPESYWYYYFAAMASGLQNAMSTKYSGNIIRTTHLTGTATDMGLVLGRLIVRRETKEVWKLQVLIPLVFGFFMGGYVAHYAALVMGRYSLLVSVVLFFLVGLAYSVFVAFRFSVPIWRILFGSYHFIQKKTKEHASKVSSAVKNTFSDIKRKRSHNKHATSDMSAQGVSAATPRRSSVHHHSNTSSGSLGRIRRSNSTVRVLRRTSSGNAAGIVMNNNNSNNNSSPSSTVHNHLHLNHNQQQHSDIAIEDQEVVGAIELVDGKHYPHNYNSLHLHDSSSV